MNVYVEEIKYLFRIVQRVVLENFDEIWNVQVIYSDDSFTAMIHPGQKSRYLIHR